LALARALLGPASTLGRRKELVMAKMFKVISPVEKDGKTKFWMRLGTAFVNRDNSINVYLDACPRSMQLQIRELDERDTRGKGEREGAGSEQLLLEQPNHTLMADAPF
jgi:hypothetical protein